MVSSMENVKAISSNKNGREKRIDSIDLLRGIVMIIMALDHVRDFFHYESSLFEPTNLLRTTPSLFFTRFITHFCAPVFVFLAGISSYLFGREKNKKELFKFLFLRGMWLIYLEIMLNNLIWTFDITYSSRELIIIWAIGVSMIFLSGLIFLPKKVILFFGLIIVFGHNSLDGIVMNDTSFVSLVWYLVHQPQTLVIGQNLEIAIVYTIIPWIGLMALGYCFGSLYDKKSNVQARRKMLLYSGLGAIIIFFILRGINVYGDLSPWYYQKNGIYTLMSFFNTTKYPPSLDFLLMTIGPALILLFFAEKIKSKVAEFFVVFGRVPLFYYFLHLFVVHLFEVIGVLVSEGNLHILKSNDLSANKLASYGYPLFMVYFVWIGIVLLLYPLCKKFMVYKARNKDKTWLSYL